MEKHFYWKVLVTLKWHLNDLISRGTGNAKWNKVLRNTMAMAAHAASGSVSAAAGCASNSNFIKFAYPTTFRFRKLKTKLCLRDTNKPDLTLSLLSFVFSKATLSYLDNIVTLSTNFHFGFVAVWFLYRLRNAHISFKIKESCDILCVRSFWVWTTHGRTSTLVPRTTL